MKKLLEQTLPQPFPPTIVIRFLLGIIVVLTFIAGYYHSMLEIEKKKLDNLQMNQYNAEGLNFKEY
ncbi:MAG: hypothetical protein ACOZAK_02375 [Patescibacteria group bacterium]